jgi:hypothetical protein
MSRLTITCGLLLLSSWANPVLATPGTQTPALPRARVYTVKAYGYELPQVQLPSAAASRRINSHLARLIFRSNVDSEVDSLAPLAQQLRRAARACCYADGHWLAPGQGFVGCTYSVLLNQGGLLSLQYNLTYCGAHEVYGQGYITFDLRTGYPVRLEQLVNDPAARLQRRMQLAVNRRFRDNLRDAEAQYGKTEKLAEVAEHYGWDWKADGVRDFGANLTQFALTPTHLLLFYAVSFHRLDNEFEPNDTYRFSYGSLLPSPLLRPATELRASSVRGKRAVK